MRSDASPEKLKPRSDAAELRASQDDLNRRIVALLEIDGRMPFSEIAQRLSISEGTVRNRVARLKESGMLRIVAIADPVGGGYEADAMIGVKVAPGCTPEAVAQRLGADARVVYILWVAGRFDLLVEIVTDDRADFLAFVETEIHGAPDVAAAEVMLGLKNLKNQFLLKRDWGTGDPS